MAVDLVIDIENTPGALAAVAAAISDAGVNLSAATGVGQGERAELHILVPHAEAVKHAFAISHVGITREREVVVVNVDDRPGVLADLTRKIAKAGVNLALRNGAMPDHCVAALGISSVCILCKKHRDFCLNRLGQEPWGALTSDRR